MRMATLYVLLAATAAAAGTATDWPAYGGSLENTRYAPLNQITTANVTHLVQAWAFDTKPAGETTARPAQTTPLVIDGVMYFVTAHRTLVALDPETGKQIWVFTHKHNARPPRGIAYWPGDKDDAARILFGTGDGFLLAVDAKTGKAIPGFGTEGEIDLKKGMKDPARFPNNHYGLSGAPMIYKNLAIVGSHTQDSPGLGSKGDARGFDVRTGKLIWTFHSVPQPRSC